MRFVWTFLGAFLLYSWVASAQPATGTFEHPNGLRLVVPQGVSVTPTANGFIVGRNPPGVQRGGGLNVVVEVTDGQGFVGRGRSRQVAPGKIFYYEVSRVPGEGSGGDEYTLKACRSEANRSICLRQSKLAEGYEPEFEAWTIAASLSLK